MLVVWDLETGIQFQSISCVYHGPVSASAWISIGQRNDESFVFGCADGTLHVYRRPSEVFAAVL